MSQLILTAVGGELESAVSLDAAPERSPSGDEVVVAVEAAPINGADVLFAAGWFGISPQVPGCPRRSRWLAAAQTCHARNTTRRWTVSAFRTP
jgi:hypothetical protein